MKIKKHNAAAMAMLAFFAVALLVLQPYFAHGHP